jgi:hypothetical protein
MGAHDTNPRFDWRSGHLVGVLGNEFAKKKVLPWEVQQAREEIAYQAYATVHDPAFQVHQSLDIVNSLMSVREI